MTTINKINIDIAKSLLYHIPLSSLAPTMTLDIILKELQEKGVIEKLIKPCPFCNGKAILDKSILTPSVTSVPSYFIICTNCNIQTKNGNKDNVINLWNSRSN